MGSSMKICGRLTWESGGNKGVEGVFGGIIHVKVREGFRLKVAYLRPSDPVRIGGKESR
jgi:hypothetical protein